MFQWQPHSTEVALVSTPCSNVLATYTSGQFVTSRHQSTQSSTLLMFVTFTKVCRAMPQPLEAPLCCCHRSARSAESHSSARPPR